MIRFLTVFFLSFSTLVFSAGYNILVSSEITIDSPFVEKSDRIRAYTQYCMGVLSEKKENVTNALKYFIAALKNDPSSGAIRLKLGALYLKRKEYEKALSIIKEALVTPHTDLFLAHFMLGLVNSQLGNSALALKEYEVAREKNPRNIGIYLTLGDLYTQKKDFSNARSVYEAGVNKNPDVAMLWFKLGLLYGKEKRYNAAINALKKAIQLKEDLFHAHLGLALIYEATQKTLSAIKEYHLILKFAPLNVDIYKRLASLYHTQKEFDKAIKIYSLLIILDSEDIANYLSLSYLFLKKGHTDRAIIILEEASQKKLKSVELFFLLGLSYEHLGDDKMSIAKTDIALTYYKKAITFFEKGTIIDSDNDLLYFHIGVCYEKAGLFDEAQKTFLKIIDDNPNHADAYNYLGYLWIEKGINLNQAIIFIKKALSLEPENGEYLDSLGWALYKKGNVEEALYYLKKAYQKIPSDAVIAYHLGEAFLKAGDWKNAVKTWYNSLENDPTNVPLQKRIQELENKYNNQSRKKSPAS
ncbi:tetratricopeptide repeat protein [Chlamydiota bacterium]